MTKEEKVLIQLLKKLNLDKQTTAAIILMLKDNEYGINMLIQYLRNSEFNQLTTQNILKKALEITKKN